MQTIPKTLFLGWGVSVVSYYRASCRRWRSAPTTRRGRRRQGPRVPPGDRPRRTARPSARSFSTTTSSVVQQPRGVQWMKFIRELQAPGVTVLYEIDDYVQSARKIKSHELTDVFDAEFVRTRWRWDARHRRHHLLHRLPRPPLPARSTTAPWACYNGIDLAATRRPKPARARASSIGWAGKCRHKARSRAGSPRCARSCASAPNAASCPWATARPSPTSRSSARSARSACHRADRGLPGVDDAVRHRDRPAGREQPVPGQERPALARGERARASSWSPTRRPTRTSTTASPACTPARRRRSRRRCSTSSTTSRSASTSAHRPTPTSPSTGARGRGSWPSVRRDVLRLEVATALKA